MVLTEGLCLAALFIAIMTGLIVLVLLLPLKRRGR